MEIRKKDNWISRLLFSPLSIEDLKMVTKQLQQCSSQCQIRLVLTNGLSITGRLAGQPLLSIEDGLTLILSFSSRYQKLGIPFSLIAGGETIKQEYSGADYRIGNEETKQINENLTHLIEAYSLQSDNRPSFDSSKGESKSMFKISGGVNLTDISYLQKTILYADWNALHRKMHPKREETWTFGWGGIGMSLKNTIQGFVWSKLKGETYNWASGEQPEEDEIVLEGCINLVSENSQLVRLNPIEIDTIDQDLITVVFSKMRMTNSNDNNVWINGILGGISLKHVDHPLSFWEKIKNPLRIYGQVIHADVESMLGNKKWFLKVMAVGVMQETL